VGTVTEGWLLQAATLEREGPDHRILPRQAARCLHYGTDELVGLVRRVAAAVAREKPGARVGVGVLAAAQGGNIIWSMSHNSGRDVDFSLYVVDLDGNPSEPPDFLLFDRHGWAFDGRGAWRLDLERTWLLLRALVEDPEVEVQFLFLYRPLQQLLLRHARARQESAELIARVATRLLEPVTPHNDHLHVRIHCSAQDLGLGCRELGPRREEAPDPAAVVGEAVQQAVLQLRATDPEQRYRAAWRLGLLGDPGARPAVAARLKDEVPGVRYRALRSLVTLGAASQTTALRRLVEREQDPAVLLAGIEALSRVGGKTAEGALRKLLTDPRELPATALKDYSAGCTPPPAAPSGWFGRFWASLPTSLTNQPPPPERYYVRAQAASGLAHAVDPGLVPVLTKLLADPAPAVRIAAHGALCRLTNHDLGSDLAAWHRFWSQHRKTPRSRWVVEGFLRAGFSVDARLGRKDVPRLLAALEGAPHVSYNARRELVRLLGPAPPGHLDWSAGDARVYWGRRWRHRGGR
jgi:penicillin-insensitive murein endopeptidase